MKTIVDVNGVVTVEYKLDLDNAAMEALIRELVVGDHLNGEIIHGRWTALYNVYDMMYSVNIRREHEALNPSLSKIEYIKRQGKMNKLFRIAAGLYKNEFEEAIVKYT